MYHADSTHHLLKRVELLSFHYTIGGVVTSYVPWAVRYVGRMFLLSALTDPVPACPCRPFVFPILFYSTRLPFPLLILDSYSNLKCSFIPSLSNIWAG